MTTPLDLMLCTRLIHCAKPWRWSAEGPPVSMSVDDVADQLASQLEAALREVARIPELEEAISDHADDICGPHPVQDPATNLAAVAAHDLEQRQRIAALEARQQELLELAAKLTRETPYPAELEECRSARRALIAEVGTLRAAHAATQLSITELAADILGPHPAATPAENLALVAAHDLEQRQRVSHLEARIALLASLFGADPSQPTEDDLATIERGIAALRDTVERHVVDAAASELEMDRADLALIAVMSAELDAAHRVGAVLVVERDALSRLLRQADARHEAAIAVVLTTKAHHESALAVTNVLHARELAMLRAGIEVQRMQITTLEGLTDHLPTQGVNDHAAALLHEIVGGAKVPPHETSASIAQWQNETFGPATATWPRLIRSRDMMAAALCRVGGCDLSVSRPNLSRAIRAIEELAELIELLVDDDADPRGGQEVADVQIVLAGIPAWHDQEQSALVDEKMAVNRARKWKTTGDGHGQHVEGQS